LPIVGVQNGRRGTYGGRGGNQTRSGRRTGRAVLKEAEGWALIEVDMLVLPGCDEAVGTLRLEGTSKYRKCMPDQLTH